MRFIMLVPVILLSCSSRSKEEKRYHESIILHNSMIKKVNQIEYRLNEIANDTADVPQDSVDVLRSLLEEWKGDLVEVPGNEDHIHDQHSHAHSHASAPDVTEEQMLAIQKELDERLSSIGKRIADLKPESNDVDHDH